MDELDGRALREYFSGEGTVSEWWTPDSGPLAFHYDAEQRILEEQLPIDPSWRVLDVGTGHGRFGVQLAGHGCRVVGVDLSREMLARATERARKRGVEERFEPRLGSATDLSTFGEGAFDAVLCMELFDHLPDLGAALREMRRVLAPGGHLVFTYVPGESLYGLLGNAYRALKRRARPGELLISRTYGLRAVREALEASGLRLERYYGVGVLCANAQTRLLTGNPLARAATAVARVESRFWPYHRAPWLARHGAHVVGFAR